MALVKTTRLNLAKQDAGDSPGTWDTAQNTGMDDADARFFLTGIVAPNISGVDSHFVGQRYYDSVLQVWWNATEIAVLSVLWIDDFTVLDLLITHPAAPTTLPADYPHGHINAALEWLSDTEVQLRPVGGNIIYYDALGTRVTLPAGVFIFDITTDREVPQSEAASTWWYLYMDNDTVPGIPEPIVSLTAPDDIGGAEPGYHPTLTDHRCVGSFYNNVDSHIQPFTIGRDGITMFALGGTSNGYDRTNHLLDLDETQSASWRLQALDVPLTADMVPLLINTSSGGSLLYAVFGGSAATITGWPTTAPEHSYGLASFDHVLFQVVTRSGGFSQMTFNMPIDDRTTPGFRYAAVRSTSYNLLEAVILGYRDMWAPTLLS